MRMSERAAYERAAVSVGANAGSGSASVSSRLTDGLLYLRRCLILDRQTGPRLKIRTDPTRRAALRHSGEGETAHERRRGRKRARHRETDVTPRSTRLTSCPCFAWRHGCVVVGAPDGAPGRARRASYGTGILSGAPNHSHPNESRAWRLHPRGKGGTIGDPRGRSRAGGARALLTLRQHLSQAHEPDPPIWSAIWSRRQLPGAMPNWVIWVWRRPWPSANRRPDLHDSACRSEPSASADWSPVSWSSGAAVAGRADRWIRWTTTGCVAPLALIAGTVSCLHMHRLVALPGQPGWVASLTPLSVDGMIVAASTTLLADSRAGRRGGALPWAMDRHRGPWTATAALSSRPGGPTVTG